MSDDTIVTLLVKITETLEAHTKIFQCNQQAFQDIYRLLTQLRKNVEGLNVSDSIKSDRKNCLKDLNTRLKVLATILPEKD